jgi:type II secretory pathway pseudopilin PulG
MNMRQCRPRYGLWPRQASRRLGKSLVEVLVLMILLNVVVALAAMTLIGTMRAERQVRRVSVQQRALTQVSSRFRSDAHRAVSCQVAEACEFKLPGGESIRYVYTSPRLAREVRRGDEVVHRDSFLLGDAVQLAFEVPESTGGNLVRLRVSPREASARPLLAATRPAVIEAALGLSREATTTAAQNPAGEELP